MSYSSNRTTFTLCQEGTLRDAYGVGLKVMIGLAFATQEIPPSCLEIGSYYWTMNEPFRAAPR
jgi:hypothetical protein